MLFRAYGRTRNESRAGAVHQRGIVQPQDNQHERPRRSIALAVALLATYRPIAVFPTVNSRLVTAAPSHTSCHRIFASGRILNIAAKSIVITAKDGAKFRTRRKPPDSAEGRYPPAHVPKALNAALRSESAIKAALHTNRYCNPGAAVPFLVEATGGGRPPQRYNCVRTPFGASDHSSHRVGVRDQGK